MGTLTVGLKYHFQMLISTLLDTIVHPKSTRNIQILINDKNEYLTDFEPKSTHKELDYTLDSILVEYIVV